MNTNAATLTMGEVTFKAKPQVLPLLCDVPGVTAQQVTRKGAGVTIEERLYRFANGAALGCRRGGPLHLGDRKAGTWEMFMLNPDGFANGGPVGFIDEKHLQRLVAHYADLVAAAA